MIFDTEKYLEISEFCKKNNKNKEKKVNIVAISKNKPLSSILEAIEFGVREFGENKVQEAISKFSNIKKKYHDVRLHMTGPLQTNKVKQSIEIFDVFQTLDREKLANEFSKHLKPNNKKEFFIQVNIGNEIQKSGISTQLADEFIRYCSKDLKIRILGLMCIPPINENPKEYFFTLADIAKKNNLNFLSMGMSSDYEQAVQAGATHIRIGTSLFGQR